jgi:hypothetical protein
MLESQLLESLPEGIVATKPVTEIPICYTIEEIYEIIRQVMFTGTPEFYDQGGITKSHNLGPNHTLSRAKAAYKKYYLKQSGTSE